MADIFISYKSERRPAAWHLANFFELYGFTAWYDYGLVPGEDFENHIQDELNLANVCIVLWCDLSISSKWVATEVDSAFKRSILVPCKIQECEIPSPYDRLDTIDLLSWNGSPRIHSLDRLLLEVSRRIGRPPVPNFGGLLALDEHWRMLGSPAMADFALSPGVKRMNESPTLRADDTTRTDLPERISETFFVGTDWRLFYSKGGHRDVWLLSDGKARWRPDGLIEKLFRFPASWSIDRCMLTIYLKEGPNAPHAFARYEMNFVGGKLMGKLYYDILGIVGGEGVHGIKMHF